MAHWRYCPALLLMILPCLAPGCKGADALFSQAQCQLVKPSTTEALDNVEVKRSSLSQADVLEVLDSIYDGHAYNASWMALDAKSVSEEHAKAASEDDMADVYVYGEIHPTSVMALLTCLGSRRGDRYYDLGSGTGKTVMVASLMGLHGTGIEAVESRSAAAERAARRLHKLQLGDGIRAPSFVHGSFMDGDFTDADIIFANSVVYTEELMLGLSERAEGLRHGAWIVSYRTFLGDHFARRGYFSGPVTWQEGSFTWTVQQVVQTTQSKGDEGDGSGMEVEERPEPLDEF